MADNQFLTSLKETLQTIKQLPGSAVTKLSTAIKSGIVTARELDKELSDLQMTTNASAKELKDFYKSSNTMAKQLGTTTVNLTRLTNAWAQLGYTLKDAQTLSKSTAILTAISPGLGLEEATAGLSNTLSAFRLDANDSLDGIISKINAIATTDAISNSDIVSILTTSANAMADANNTLEQTIALGTAATQITGNAELVGDALNTISTNIRQFSEETGLASTSTYDFIANIAEVWDAMSTKDQTQLLETLGGTDYAQTLSAMISNFNTAENAMNLMSSSAGSAMTQMEKVYDRLDYKLNRLSETGTGIAKNLFQGDDMNTVVSGLTAVGNVIEKITEKLGLFGTLTASGGLFAGFKTGKSNHDFALYGGDSISQLIKCVKV